MMMNGNNKTEISLIRGDVVKTLRHGVETGDMEGAWT